MIESMINFCLAFRSRNSLGDRLQYVAPSHERLKVSALTLIRGALSIFAPKQGVPARLLCMCCRIKWVRVHACMRLAREPLMRPLSMHLSCTSLAKSSTLAARAQEREGMKRHSNEAILKEHTHEMHDGVRM
jgi:hypothetical protein